MPKVTLDLDTLGEKAILDSVEETQDVVDNVVTQMRQNAVKNAYAFFQARQAESNQALTIPVSEDALLDKYFKHPKYMNAKQRKEAAKAAQEAKKQAIEDAKKNLESG